MLRLPALVQPQPPQHLLGEVAADAVAEDGDLGADVHARLEAGLLLPVLADAAVAGPDAR